MGAEGLEGGVEDEGAAIYLLLDGVQNSIYGVLGLLSKMLDGVGEWMDTP